MFKKSWNDAKKVVAKGNMFMLAIGLLLGTVFGALVASLANDIIMGAIVNAVGDKMKDLSDMKHGAILYGKFIGALINFLIVTGFIFFGLLIVYLIKNYRDSKKPKPAPVAPVPTTEELILAELKKLNSNK
ncbi:large conductance mechanosensitive channel protein MscL [[Mycoplasma] gypis]|uniref:MscL family protein n=1 Tax=[Mycoplasma] gypis TaxID=92404 RepID=A0ABZ2RVY5_9BACT|nr:MscL family protein [[Mycoplasma] gypis]MBN0919606.1 MscL family protein [[Mycoplasma] gypis]